MENKRTEEITKKLMEYEMSLHIRNQKRIKIGLRCFIFVPIVFLILMFLTESSKLIFLALWIVSLFAMSIYLIAVEYADYTLQQKLNEIYGRPDAQINDLINISEMDIVKIVDKIKEEQDESDI